MRDEAVSEVRVAFFGCWGEPGHYLFGKGKARLSPTGCFLPPDHAFDASPLLLPQPEVVGEGQCTYLPAWNLTVLSWWNGVFDSRGKVNSHVMYRGEASAQLMWDVFEHNFPEVAQHHTRPTIKVVFL